MGVEDEVLSANQPADVWRIGEVGFPPSEREFGQQIEQSVGSAERGGIGGFNVALRGW